jgi:hypothetical protein
MPAVMAESVSLSPKRSSDTETVSFSLTMGIESNVERSVASVVRAFS